MNLIYQIILIATMIISSFTPSKLISEEKVSEDFVYICNKPGQKCYYLLPCNDLRVSCNNAKGKLFKVPLSRAVQMKRTKCDCKENN